MKIVILGSSGPDGVSRQYVSTYLVNRRVAIDAGCLGFRGTPEEQRAVRHVFLTHAHADHTASLPSFLENAWTPDDDCANVYGSPETLATVRRYIFNGEVWADLVALSDRMPPFLRLHALQPEVPVEVEGLTVTPVPVDHLVPTLGFVVRGDRGAVIFGADSGPTMRLWEAAHQVPSLHAVFLEASFPDRMAALAEATCHLTPSMVAREAAKLPAGVRIIAVHLKVPYREEIRRELEGLRIPHLEIGECDREYSF